MTQSTSTISATTFAQLGLVEPLLRALTEKNYTHPSPIQAEAIPHLLAGRDLMGSAQTGTGKTAAFALPILQKLSLNLLPRVARSPRALILTPTRELAVQIADSFAAYGKYMGLRHVVIYGGVGQGPQVRGAQQADIVIATPGRLLDLAQQGYIRFDHVAFFVLDEADRMLDMGFAPDIKRIIGKLPQERQSLLFSATMPASILDLASRVVRRPVRVEMTPESPTVDRIAQRVCYVDSGKKYPLLRHILDENPSGLVLVFMRTKHSANKLAKNLGRDGYTAEAIHGNKSQAARQRALETFRSGSVQILVATDVAARGIDVKGIALVINYDIPNEPEAYVHRIGRTARAGTEGTALSFCDSSERNYLRGIQRLIRQNIPVHTDHPFASASPVDRERTHRAPTPGAFGQRPPQDHRPDHGHSHRPSHGAHSAHSARPSHAPRPAHAARPTTHSHESASQENSRREAPRPHPHSAPRVGGHGHRPNSGGRVGFAFSRQRRGGR